MELEYNSNNADALKELLADKSRQSSPLVNVSLNDARAFVKWLNGETGKRYRVPSRDEWERACKKVGQELDDLNSTYSEWTSTLYDQDGFEFIICGPGDSSDYFYANVRRDYLTVRLVEDL